MSTREKLRKFKSDVKSLISPASRAIPSPQPSPKPGGVSTSSTAPPSENNSKNWKNLRLLGRTLDQSTRSFSPLREAVQAGGRKEYDVLQDSLEVVFEELQQNFTQTMPPAMTATIEGLCKSIKQELIHIQEKHDRGKLRHYAEAENDQEDILACYRRIQSHLQRVTFNVDMKVWRVVDEIVADNRLKYLSPSLSARYNSSQAVELKRGPCTNGTRIDLLGQMLVWTDNASLGSVYWMSGMAGTGKTTIAYSLCEELDRSDRLAASFFCSRLIPGCRDVSRIVPSISYQLARTSYPFRTALLGVLEEDPDVHTSLPRMQFDALISQPLLEVKHTLPDNLVVVIDALDECEDKESTRQILEVLIARSSTLPVKFVVSSRPEPEVRDEMQKQGDGANSQVVLHELDKHIVQTDIELYLRTALAPMEPTEDQLKTLVERAGTLFIYAATAVRYIGYDNFQRRPRTRLADILCTSHIGANNGTENKYTEIDELYTTIIRGAMSDPRLNDAEVNDMRQVLHTVTCAQEPLTVLMLSILLMMDVDRVRAALRPLWSILHVSGAGELATTLHASFTDYMLDPTRSKQYHCNYGANNHLLARRCFGLFRGAQQQFNICGLESSYITDEKVSGLEDRVQRAVTTELFYAARYWADHLCSADESPNLIRYLEEFLSGQLLLWMEVMNLKKCMGAMPGMVQSVKKWAMECPTALKEFLHDAWLFTTTFASGAVSNSTPHIYVSMLPFWPTSSPIAKAYLRNTQGMIKTKGCPIAPQPRALLATWEFSDGVYSPVFSPDCSQVAVGVGYDILLLNASTGRMKLSPLKGHLDTVKSVRFSPDGARIVSGAEDMAIRVWSTRSGETILGPLKEHTSVVYSVAFSPDGDRIVSGSGDGTINIWDAFSGARLLGPLKEAYGILRVEYSPNGRFIISCGQGPSVAIRNAQDGAAFKALCGSSKPRHWHYSFAISPDGNRIAASTSANNVCVWDFETGQLILGPLIPTADAGMAAIVELTFSPGGYHLISGSFDGTMCVWDTRNGSMKRSFQVHTGSITSINFSPDGAYLISGSRSKTVRLWDPWNTGSSLDPFPGHSASVNSVGFSPNNTQIVSGAQDGGVYVWDAGSGDMILGPLRQDTNVDNHTAPSISVSYSADGACIISATSGGLALLDAYSGIVGLRPHQDFNHYCPAMLSSDDTLILSASRTSNYDEVVRVLSADTGQTLMTIYPPGIRSPIDQVTLTIFSPDDTLIAVRLNGDKLIIFDARSGCLLYGPYRGSYGYHSYSIGFHPDGGHIVFGSDSEIHVQDVRCGEVVLGPLRGHSSSVASVEFSPDGTQIVSGGIDNSICVWNAQTGQLVLGPVKWHHDAVKCVRFSLDGTRIVSGSNDKTIRVTNIRANPRNSSDSPPSAVDDWQMNTDGWVISNQGQLLVWIPPDLRTMLMWPRTEILISKKGWFQLDFSDARIGGSWAESHQPLRPT